MPYPLPRIETTLITINAPSETPSHMLGTQEVPYAVCDQRTRAMAGCHHPYVPSSQLPQLWDINHTVHCPQQRASNRGLPWQCIHFHGFITSALVEVRLTPSTMYAFHLILVDAYSQFICIYGLPNKTNNAVIAALQQYQAGHHQATIYGYLDVKIIRADAGSS